MLYDAGLISEYTSKYADNKMYIFFVGNMTQEGCDYLDSVRDDSRCGKIKALLKEKGLSFTIEAIKAIISTL